jgi:hypothetical protein
MYDLVTAFIIVIFLKAHTINQWSLLRWSVEFAFIALKNVLNPLPILSPLHYLILKLHHFHSISQNKQTPLLLVHKRTIPTEWMLRLAKWCWLFWVDSVVWSVQQIPMTINLGFLDRSCYFFFQVAPQLSSLVHWSDWTYSRPTPNSVVLVR